MSDVRSPLSLASLLLASLLGAGLAAPVHAQRVDPPLVTKRIASGFSRPVFLTSPPGDYRRMFVVEQRTGRIEIIKGGVTLPVPFLDLGGISSTSGNERGLLGMAFHPDYASNGLFYVNYTRDANGDTVIARYSVSANPDVADAASGAILQVIDQPYSNHNGGMLAFGPDGYLYIGLGDGGSGGDPQGNGQKTTTMLGKMLRIDVDVPSGWGIPPTNPFVNDAGTLDEIWAVGLRNPWRYSFDRETGDLYIGDVGQNLIEEIDFQPAASLGGENYGWSCMEGNNCFNGSGCTCNAPTLTNPIYDYTHSAGCSITGGYVYRGKAIPGLEGTYFFADYCTSKIWSFRYDGTTMTSFTDRTAELTPPAGQNLGSIASFGENAWGELFLIDLDGEIYQILPADPIPQWANYGAGWPGTLGVPSLTLDAVPELCTHVQVQMGNSLGTPTTAALLLGLNDDNVVTVLDGTLLVAAPSVTMFVVPAGGLNLPFSLPCTPALCGLDLYLQVLETDSGATQGLSFSQGLSLTLGI